MLLWSLVGNAMMYTNEERATAHVRRFLMAAGYASLSQAWTTHAQFDWTAIWVFDDRP